MIESFNQIRQDVETESSLIKNRKLKMEDRIENNEHNIAKIYETMKQYQDTNINPQMKESFNVRDKTQKK